MIKRYANLSIFYAILALAFGVFYREFTKAMQFTEGTTLSVIHPHLLMLGTIMFLLLIVLEKNFAMAETKNWHTLIVFYNVGLSITVLGLLVRGLTQVLGSELSGALDASISGVSGLGHTILGVSLVIVLFQIKKQAVQKP